MEDAEWVNENKGSKEGYTIFEIVLIIIIVLYLLAGMAFSLCFIFLPLGDYLLDKIITSTDPQKPFYVLSSTVFMAGFLGGSFYTATGLYRRLTNDGKKRKVEVEERFEIRIWFYWHVFRPFQGGILSLIILAMLNAGFVGLSNIKDPNTQTLYFQISLGFLVGFGTHEVLMKINEIIKVTFSTAKQDSKESVHQESFKKIEENKKQGLPL
jgi:hypothetical protein